MTINYIQSIHWCIFQSIIREHIITSQIYIQKVIENCTIIFERGNRCYMFIDLDIQLCLNSPNAILTLVFLYVYNIHIE